MCLYMPVQGGVELWSSGGGGEILERGCEGVCLCDDVNCDKYRNGEEEVLDEVMLGNW